MSVDLVSWEFWSPVEEGSVSFDCVNGRNVHLPAVRVRRRRDRVMVWWPTRSPRPDRTPVWARDNPFRGSMRLRGILTLFGPDGRLLMEDLVRVDSVNIMPERADELGGVRASCYRYHPRPTRA